MKFYLSNYLNGRKVERKNILVLTALAWDDWFEFSTLYNLRYYNEDGILKDIGSLKIGQKDMTTGQRSPELPETFTRLRSPFFSIGQDVTYYETINNIGDDFRRSVLSSLNDIAFDNDKYTDAVKERVTRISLLRYVTPTSAEGQFRRLAQGQVILTPYDFKFFTPKVTKTNHAEMVLDFNVIPDSNPPTNIHVIIGRNGVGKTHLFNNMISALLGGNISSSKYGYFSNGNETDTENLFANLVSVSFSAFDESTPIEEKKDKTRILNYSYIGLKRVGTDTSPKSPTILKNEFVKSVKQCMLGAKNDRWIKALETLETDPIFSAAQVSSIAKLSLEDDFEETAASIFNKLSSGHKIVLLSITRLIDTVEERSLVLLDEPEGYLHPPLLAAFIRALSDLLIKRNAVAIIGTHSPVVLQEVPRSCVWKLRRHGANAEASRLEIESFGENVGLLTQEVFGLEVTDAGFHKILKTLAENSDSYREAAGKLNDQLGSEGKAILRNLLYKNNAENR